jgi:hypothetical protein
VVDALYVDPKGIYPRLLGPEHCWDEARDARTYAGPGPVVGPILVWRPQRSYASLVGPPQGCQDRRLPTP